MTRTPEKHMDKDESYTAAAIHSTAAAIGKQYLHDFPPSNNADKSPFRTSDGDLTSGDCSVFDLRADPGEKSDLAAPRPELAQIARRLARLHVRQGERERVSRAVRQRPELSPTRGSACTSCTSTPGQ